MNETIYRLAEEGASIRIVLQKKPDGDFILGISNGKYKALICQGEEKQVDAEFEAALPGYLEELKAAAIEAQLLAAEEENNDVQPASETSSTTSFLDQLEQPELDLFNF